jgi:glucose-1-phosphate cytidylyltransferase
MKVVLLAGGRGTRISEETGTKPKPMVEIGERPIIWHIMKIYSHFGFDDFIICLGYKGYMIKEFFANYFLHRSDVIIDLDKNAMEVLETKAESWKICLVNTGLETMTGGRIKRIQKYVGKETFMLTYGDGVADMDLSALLAFHKEHGKLATLTSVQPAGRFGALRLDENQNVKSFAEKPRGDGSWFNGGFFVLEPEIFDYIEGDHTTWEQEPLQNIAKDGQLVTFHHHGFWKPMDTLRDKLELEAMWNSPDPPWKFWEG